jgi:cytoskeleton protein RodZ
VDNGIGGILREARNRRQLDLSEVEGAIKIRTRYLLAMENEEWDVLPGGAYTRGFIRTYASYLGLDGDRIAEDFRNATAGGERMARAEPVAPLGGRPSPRAWVPGRAVAVLLVGGLAAAMVVIGLLSGGGGGPAAPPVRRGDISTPHRAVRSGRATAPRSVAIRVTATAEVWVCLLDARGRRLINGQILEAGAEEGPFRSNRFLLSLGNGQVALSVNSKAIAVPETASPIGYRIGADGRLNTLSEAERPTCT